MPIDLICLAYEEWLYHVGSADEEFLLKYAIYMELTS